MEIGDGTAVNVWTVDGVGGAGDVVGRRRKTRRTAPGSLPNRGRALL